MMDADKQALINEVKRTQEVRSVIMQGQNLWTGYFPIRIYLRDRDQCMVCNTPQDIPNGETFVVLKCNVEVAANDYQI